MSHQPAIREEELKNRIAAMFFGKYDCTRIVGTRLLPRKSSPRSMNTDF